MGVEDVFHGIEANRRFTYFALEIKQTHETKWGFPFDELFPVAELKDSFGKPRTEEWFTPSWDAFGYIIEPWTGPGNSAKPEFRASHDETHFVRSKTGRRGWWSYMYAQAGAKRFRDASELHTIKHYDGYGNLTSRAKYDVRIVKVTVAKVVEVVQPEEDAPCGV